MDAALRDFVRRWKETDKNMRRPFQNAIFFAAFLAGPIFLTELYLALILPPVSPSGLSSGFTVLTATYHGTCLFAATFLPAYGYLKLRRYVLDPDHR